MHGFPQFTRSTLWGELAWVGTIIFVGILMVWGQSSGVIFLVGNGPRGKFQCRQLSGGEAIFLVGNCPSSHLIGVTESIAKTEKK